MTRRKSIVGAVVSTVALVATLTIAGGATANAATKLPTIHRAPAGASCWVDASTKQSLCVSKGHDLFAAVELATGKHFVLPSGLRIGGVTVSAARVKASIQAAKATTAASGKVVSAIYDDVSYGGGTLVLTGGGSGCDFAIDSLGDYGWNDRSSSFKSYSGCTTAIWRNDNFGGTRYGYYGNKSSFGSMNDQASSWGTT